MILKIENLNKISSGHKILSNINFNVKKNNTIYFEVKYIIKKFL